MEIALEKLPLEERGSLLKQLWESVKQDDPEALKFVYDEGVESQKIISTLSYALACTRGVLYNIAPEDVPHEDYEDIRRVIVGTSLENIEKIINLKTYDKYYDWDVF